MLIAKTIADVEQTLRESKSPGLHSEGKRIIRELVELKEDMDRDRPLRYDALPSLALTCSPIPDDKQPNLHTYNDELRRLNRPTWRNVSWLYSECYLYRYTPMSHYSANLKSPEIHVCVHPPLGPL